MIFTNQTGEGIMPRFSANLGFLWTDVDLPDAIHAAHQAGFDAVECHWPYAYATDQIVDALAATGLPMLALNTPAGNMPAEFGLAAVPERQADAEQGIRNAITYAHQIGAKAVHVMAGKAPSDDPSDQHFQDMLIYAANMARPYGLDILIEAINPIDVAGYFLNDVRQAVKVLETLSLPNLGLMFDCYHVGKMGGDILAELAFSMPWIRHIQIASIPDRHEPDDGHVDYHPIYQWLDDQGYDGFIGAEYRPKNRSGKGDVADGLNWLKLAQC